MAQEIAGLAPSGSPIEARFNEKGALWVADHMPQGAEASKNGDRFMLGYSAAVTGIANVSAVPTTATMWAIANADPTNSYFLEEIGVYLTSGTPGVGGILIGCLFRTPLAPTSDTGISVVNTNPNSAKVSKAIVKSAQTVTASQGGVAAPTWYTLASNSSPNVTAFAGSTFLEHRALAGRITIPPSWSLGLHVVAPAGTSPLFAPFGMWVEKAGVNP